MDAARRVAQSDLDRKPNFRRRCSATPLEQTRPQLAEKIQGAQDCLGISSDIKNSDLPRFIEWADHLDRMALAEVILGHVVVAERLSQKAAELRESADP